MWNNGLSSFRQYQLRAYYKEDGEEKSIDYATLPISHNYLDYFTPIA